MTDTSHEAYGSIKSKTPPLREQVFEYIRSVGGATDEEMQAGLTMSPNTQRPRRRELVQAKRVVDSGVRRKTQSGHEAIVWVVDGKTDIQRSLF